jgi:hypothetical protein
MEGEFSSILGLLDHPVRSRQHIRCNRQADLLRGFQVNDQLKPAVPPANRRA